MRGSWPAKRSLHTAMWRLQSARGMTTANSGRVCAQEGAPVVVLAVATLAEVASVVAAASPGGLALLAGCAAPAPAGDRDEAVKEANGAVGEPAGPPVMGLAAAGPAAELRAGEPAAAGPPARLVHFVKLVLHLAHRGSAE